MTENKSVGLIILAAGGSSRFGKPKQLAQLEGKSFVRRAVEKALQSECNPVIVVLGSSFESVKNEIKNYECQVVFNKNWKTGMSSSIRKGLQKLLELTPNISGVIVSLCDLPFITSDNYNELISRFYESEKPIVASAYKDTIGVPALFSNQLFPKILKLEGDSGAKKIIKNHSESVEKFYLSEAEIDIDTPEDFEKLKNIF